jgi:hypothetical protein
MNVNIRKTFKFQCVTALEETTTITSFTATVFMVPETESSDNHYIAYERISYWIHEVLDNSVLISRDNKNLTHFENIGMRCLILPDDPHDHFVAALLSVKLNAICEGELSVTDVEVSNVINDGIIYMQSCEDDPMIFAEQGWWQDAAPSWFAKHAKNKSQAKVISLSPKVSWKDHDLAWATSKNDRAVIDISVTDDPTK